MVTVRKQDQVFKMQIEELGTRIRELQKDIQRLDPGGEIGEIRKMVEKIDKRLSKLERSRG